MNHSRHTEKKSNCCESDDIYICLFGELFHILNFRTTKGSNGGRVPVESLLSR
uniref:Bm14122 n=1 Tax=Brugia malayi TaxID=6279 RepID=A0A1I9G818_BRUMA|nr:Bm14122 [Brugia malayi]